MTPSPLNKEGRCPEILGGHQCIHATGHHSDHFAKDASSYYVWPLNKEETERGQAESVAENFAAGRTGVVQSEPLPNASAAPAPRSASSPKPQP